MQKKIDLRLYLHIGQQKTGSTTLQYFLQKNREQLAKKKILYPKAFGNLKHFRLLKNNTVLKKPNNKYVEEFRNELAEKKWKSVILSDENLFVCRLIKRAVLIDLLKEFFDDIVIVVYLRRQDEHLVSNYQQQVKGEITLTLEEYIEHIISRNYYNYFSVIKSWEKLLPDATFNLRPFGKLINNNITEDFCVQIGVKPSKYKHDLDRANKSKSALTIELLRKLNIIKNGQQAEDLEEEELVEFKEKVKLLRAKILDAHLQSEKLNLSTKHRRQVMKKFRPSNKKLFAKFDATDEFKEYFKATIKQSEGFYNDSLETDFVITQLLELMID